MRAYLNEIIRKFDDSELKIASYCGNGRKFVGYVKLKEQDKVLYSSLRLHDTEIEAETELVQRIQKLREIIMTD